MVLSIMYEAMSKKPQFFWESDIEGSLVLLCAAIEFKTRLQSKKLGNREIQRRICYDVIV